MSGDVPRAEVTAIIRASREHVFDAWLSADRLTRFLCAGDTHVASESFSEPASGTPGLVM